jgi:hypothetical protein
LDVRIGDCTIHLVQYKTIDTGCQATILYFLSPTIHILLI